MYGGLDIAVSGMVAQRTRLNTIAANIANAGTTRNANGEAIPYRRKSVIFMPGDPNAQNKTAQGFGVHVHKIKDAPGDFRKVYDPSHPDAKPEGHEDAGYVYYPNIDTTTEQVNAMDAQRAYEANVASAEAMKALVAQALRMLG